MIMLVTGGTGGHVFPAVALKDYLAEKNIPVSIIVDQRGNKFVQNKQNVQVISIFRSVKILGKFGYPFSLFFAFLKSLKLFIINKPKMLIGFGGYTTLPALLAGYCLGIPVCIFEANAFLGKANRFLQKLARYVFVAFPDTKFVQHKNVHQTGLPIRKELRDEKFIFREPQEEINILIIGGSQGTSLFSTIIPEAIKQLPENIQRKINIHQQVRQESYDQVKSAYDSLKLQFVLKPFFDDMLFEYRWADCVIARSGASTVFELIHAKKPAILFPYAKSIEGDQLENAKFLLSHNAAWVFNENALNIEDVSNCFKQIIENKNLLKEKSSHIEKLEIQNSMEEFLSVIRKYMV